MSKSVLRFVFRKDIIIAVMMFAVVIVMIVPIHPVVMDVLITLNMTLSILILMTSIYITTPLGFVTFPSVILLATTLRIALSVATTRLILTTANGGEIIRAFGDFAVSGNVVVGLIIFLIITIIQFVVVTKGAERIAEVSARFKLDALPGRQMSIEADSKSGDMTQNEVRQKRENLTLESQYFGSMDGAMKFVKGDAIAGLIITAVNLIGGILVGVGQLDLSFGEAVRTFSLLTVGDGLVAQIPALFIALSAGTIVTRVAQEKSQDLGSEIATDLVGQPQALLTAAAIVFVIGLIPSFPFLIFASSSAILLGIAYVVNKREAVRLAESSDSPAVEAEEALSHHSDRLTIASGTTLYNALNKNEFRRARAEHARAYEEQIGVKLPYFGLVKDDTFEPERWEIRRDGVPAFFTQTKPDSVFVTGDPNVATLATEIEPTLVDLPQHRVYRFPASAREALDRSGIPFSTPAEVIAEAGVRIVAINNGIMFGLTELEEYLENLNKRERQFLDQILEVIDRQDMIGIISHLLVEQVPITPRLFFLDSMAYAVNDESSPQEIAEGLRYLLRRQICGAIADEQNVIGSYIIDRDIDIMVLQSMPDPSTGDRIPLDLNKLRGALAKVHDIQRENELTHRKPVLIASEKARSTLRGFLFRQQIYLPVLSQDELADEFTFEPLGLIGL